MSSVSAITNCHISKRLELFQKWTTGFKGLLSEQALSAWLEANWVTLQPEEIQSHHTEDTEYVCACRVECRNQDNWSDNSDKMHSCQMKPDNLSMNNILVLNFWNNWVSWVSIYILRNNIVKEPLLIWSDLHFLN